jgi:hypothetical protein
VPSAKDQTLPAEAASPPEETRARRRVPALVLGLGGAAIAAVYGVVVMRLRFGPPLVVLALGGLTLVLSGIALWRVLDPLSRANVISAAAPRAPARLRELEREKQLVLKAIKEVELDYQMRKIDEAGYRDMIERYRARAMRLIGEIEAGDNFRPLIERELRDRIAASDASAAETAEPAEPNETVESAAAAAPAATAEAGACPACGTKNDEDARFCKKCGGKLGIS